jgi:hypothetical protein
VSAPDGIFAKDNDSFIIGNQVELYAQAGSIGTVENPIFIDSDVHGAVGDGGVLAWAQGDIHIREIEGDLYLAEQLDLASGFDESNAEEGLSNLQSTYDEIRPDEDGSKTAFAGSIHSTTGTVNIEVVAGSVIDAIEEGFVPLTPEEIKARNAKLGLTGPEGRAAALAELDADANAKTEAYHRYWKEFRGATNVEIDSTTGEPALNEFGQLILTTPTVIDVLDVNAGTEDPPIPGTEILQLAVGHGLETGDEVFIDGVIEQGDTNLINGAAYYVIKVSGSDTEIKLAKSRADAAINENPFDIVEFGDSLGTLRLLRYDYTEDPFAPDLIASSLAADYTTADTPTQIVTDDIVELISGERFVYRGAADIDTPNLGSIDYANDPNWQQLQLPIAADYTTADTPTQIVTDDIVELASGEKYVYNGTDNISSPNLNSIDYANDSDWSLVIDSVYGGIEEVERAYESNDTLFGSRDEYDPDFVFTYSQADKEAFVLANTFSLEALENPVSPGLMKELYPLAEFSNSTPVSESTESANITGNEVSIVVGTDQSVANGEGSIGSKSDLITIVDPANFEAVSDEGKIAMANATPDDLVGVHYKIYEYTGTDGLSRDLRDEDFTTGPWSEVLTIYETGTDPTAVINETVSENQTVLVQLDSSSYGLYRYVGTNPFNGNIANKDIYLGSDWVRLTDDGGTRAEGDLNHANDSGTVTLIKGDVYLDKINVQTLTLQLFEDIDIESQDDAAVNFGARAGDQVIVQTTDNLKIHHVLAGGDVRLQSTSSGATGGSITGDGILTAPTQANNAAANNVAIGTLGNLILLADTSIGTDADPLRIQVAYSDISGEPSGKLSVNVGLADLYIHQVADTTLNIFYEDNTPPTTLFDPADRGFSVTLDEKNDLDYVIDFDQMRLPQLIRIDAPAVNITDLSVENASAGEDLLIHVIDESTPANTGNLRIGKISAGSTVDLRAADSIFDLFEDAPAPIVNILTNATSSPGDVFLQAGNDIGTIDNFIDVTINGDLTGLLGQDAYIHSIGDLYVGGKTDPVPANAEQGLESTDGNISLLIDGTAFIGLISANASGDRVGVPDGLVTIQATETIVDRRNDSLVNIWANAAILKTDQNVGEEFNALDTDLDQLEAYVPTGDLWLDNVSDMSIGQITGNSSSGFNPDGIFDDVDGLADPSSVIADEIGVFVNGTLDISNIGDLTLFSTSVSNTEVLIDVTGAILDNVEGSLTKDIIAPEALLVASDSVGTNSNEIETLLDNLEGRAGSGGFFVDDMMGLIIGEVLALQGGVDVGVANEGISADGTIRVTTTGFMRVREDVESFWRRSIPSL